MATYSVNLTPADQQRLDRLPINRQAEIKTKTGGPLVLSLAYEAIGRASNNRTEANPKALEADRLLAQLIAQKGFTASGGAMPAVTSTSSATATPATPVAPAPPVAPADAAPMSAALIEAHLRTLARRVAKETDPNTLSVLAANQRTLERALKRIAA